MDDRDRTERRPMWVPWAMTSLVFLLVAFVAYAVGEHQGVEIAGGDNVVRTWHVGFPGFGFFLLMWVFLFGFRRLFWGWGCSPYYYRPWRYRRYYPHPYDDEREWEDWHRREHERMRASGASESADRRGAPGSPQATP